MNDQTQNTGPRETARLAANDAGIRRAAALIRAGRLVAFPTETVYGLGADATAATAVAAIFRAKQRPRFNPLISHVADVANAFRHGRFDADARALAAAFWPGPLTLVVPKAEASPIADLVTAGLATVALRVPAHPLAHALLAEAGVPVAAPSANRSGRVSPTMAAHVLADLAGAIDAVLDGGPTPVGLESTIVACLGGELRLLRPGGIPRAAIEEAIGRPVQLATETGAAPQAPGMLASHYAPRAGVRLRADEFLPGEAALLFGRARQAGLGHAVAALNLSEDGDLTEAAVNLFAHLRALDATGAAVIAVSPIPRHGLGEAINDRLDRAAAKRTLRAQVTP